MPRHPIAIGIALVALALALWLLIAAVRRHRWTSLFQAVPALGLLAVVALLVPYILGLNITQPPHPFYNRPAAVPAGTIVYYRSVPDPNDNHLTLYAVDGQTGKTLWQRPPSSTSGFDMAITPAGNAAYIAPAQGAVYIATDASDQAGQSNVAHVLAFDVATGSVLWQRTLTGRVVSSVPFLAQDTIFVTTVVSSSPLAFQLFALRPSDGAQLWSARLSFDCNYTDGPRLFAGPGVLYVQSPCYFLEARRLTDGKLLWTIDPNDATNPNHYTLQGQLLAGTDAVYDVVSYGSVTAYSAQTGARLWQSGNNDFFDAGVFSDGTLYVTGQHNVEGDTSGKRTNFETLYALDAATGQPRWTYATHAANHGQLVLGPDAVYIQADDGIHALRASDGTLLWHSQPHTSWVFAAPAPVVGSTLYVTAIQLVPPPEETDFSLFTPEYGQDYLYAVNTANGSADWGVVLGPVFRIPLHGL